MTKSEALGARLTILGVVEFEDGVYDRRTDPGVQEFDMDGAGEAVKSWGTDTGVRVFDREVRMEAEEAEVKSIISFGGFFTRERKQS